MAEDFSEVVKTQKEQLAATKKASGLSQKRLERAAELTEQIDAQNQKMEEQRTLLEKQGIDTKSNKKFQAEELKLAKLEKSRAKATGSADAEDAAKEKIANQKGNTFLGKIAGGIGGLLKSGKEKVKSGASSLFGMLKKFAIGGLAIAALAFLNNPKFDEIVKTIKERIIPALTTLVDDYLIPIGNIFWDGIVKAWGIIKNLFSDLKDSFDLFKEGKWYEGIKKFFSGIGTALVSLLDTAATTVYNSIASIFGLESTDSVVGSITKFFKDIYNNIKQSITDTVDSIKQTFTEAYDKFVAFVSELNVFKFVEDTVSDLMTSVKGIFAGDFSIENFKSLFGSLFDIAQAPLNLIINTIKDIFKFGDVNEPFKLSTFISESTTKIIDWFKNLLDFDFSSILKSIPGAETVMKLFESDKTPAAASLVDRQADIQKQIREQKDEIFSGDNYTGADLFRGGQKRADVIKRLEKELIEIKRERAAQKSNASTSIVNAPTNVHAPSNTSLSTNVGSLTNTDRVTDTLSTVN